MASIEKVRFENVNLSDIFFNSLKSDYEKFENWFKNKAKEEAYILKNENNHLQAFLYMKIENEVDPTIQPCLPNIPILKIGTFKINAHGSKLGERFIKLIFDKMIEEKIRFSYVTIYKKQSSLIELLKKFGFVFWGKKNEEEVYVKNFDYITGNIQKDYPLIDLRNNNKCILAIYPKFHTKLFPDSKLRTERNHIVEDLSYTNCIEKIYLSGSKEILNYKEGDSIVIYRTSEEGRPAEYSSVVTSICTIKDIRTITSFTSFNEFLSFCKERTIFTTDELKKFWYGKKYPYIITMLYNLALNKRIIRKELIENFIINRDARIVVYDINDEQMENVLTLGRNDSDFLTIK